MRLIIIQLLVLIVLAMMFAFVEVINMKFMILFYRGFAVTIISKEIAKWINGLEVHNKNVCRF